MRLWSSEDDYAGHFRRYTIEEIRSKAENAGFTTLYSGYFMRFLVVPIFLGRVCLEKIGLLKRQDQRTDEERKQIAEKQFKTKKGGIINRVLEGSEDREYSRIISGKELSSGASVILVLKR